MPGEAPAPPVTYRFDGYQLDAGTLELEAPDGHVVDLAPTAFDLLVHLVRHRRRVVTKEELTRQLWPDVVVNENALAQCVWAARRAVGDGGRNQRLIKNVRGRGYRFVGHVAEAAPQAGPSQTPPALAGRPFLGRDAEMKWLESALADARDGRGRICLLGGEAGVGKTRIAQELAHRAAASGIDVLEGRGFDDEGMPAYWPFRQILRALVARRDDETLAELLGPEGPDVAKLVPELRHRLPQLGDSPERAPDDDRYYLFQAVADLLRRASGRQPLLLLLDDVHWLDPSSLSLLKFLAPSLGSDRIALLITFRTEELGPSHAKVIASVLRQAGAEQREVPGLTRVAVAELLEKAGHPAAGDLVERVATLTAGNPLFVLQVAPLLLGAADRLADLSELELPQAVQDALGRKIGRLRDESRSVLRVAAVLGQSFNLGDLRRSMQVDTPALLRALSELGAHRVVQRSAKGDGVYEFAHPLVRETVYRGLPEAERVLLHRDVARSIDAAYADWPFARLEELAHHYAAAASAGVAAKAIHYVRLAAEKAFEATAFEEAARHYRSALSLLDMADGQGEPQRCELLLGLGHSLRGSGADATQVRSVFQEAAERARASSRSDLFADAALGFAGGGPLHLGALTEMGLVDATEVSLLSAAEELLGSGDSEKKTQVLSWLARSLYHSADTERRTWAADGAVAMARRLGSEAALGAALYHRQHISRSPHVLGARIEDLTELVAIAERTGARDLHVEARVELAWALVQAGRVADAEAEVSLASRVAAELGQPASLRPLDLWQLVHAYVRENVDEVLARDFERLMRRRNAKTTQTFGLRLMMARFMQSRATETLHLSEQYVENLPLPVSWRCGLCSTYAIVGRTEESRKLFEDLAATGFSGVPMTHDWLSSYMLLSTACCLLGDARRAPVLRDLLAPFESVIQVMGFGTFILGPVALPLGELSTLLRDWAEAERYYRIALDLARRLRSPSITAWVGVSRAAMLAERRFEGDVMRAHTQLAEVSPDIARTGFVHLQNRAAEIERKLGVTARA